MDDLPAVLLLQVLRCLDHAALHAAEQTSLTWRTALRDSQLWRELVDTHVSYNEALRSKEEWKQVACLAHRHAQDNEQLLGGVQAFSSADRSSESPVNTLTASRCWMELHQLQVPGTDQETELRTLGERIQHRCGCSAGQSCYWSSSASLNQNASEFIDYTMSGSCVVTAVQIVPYRVFWHPESPTYAPQRVRFEFFDVDDHISTVQQGAMGGATLHKTTVKPFYASHDYDVKNDMTLQEFELPRKVLASEKTVLRITLIGRHQAQTFELPQDAVDGDEDRRPKYYCCISHVNIRGVLWTPLPPQPNADLRASPLYKMSPNLRMAALTGLAMYLTACY